jgi:YfiH family protein
MPAAMIELYQSELLTAAGFPDHGFTQRTGGVSAGPFASLNLAHDVGDDAAAVAANLERLRRHVGLTTPLQRVVQVHGADVLTDDSPELAPDATWTAAPTVEADGVVVARGSLTAAVQTADCAAVLLAAPRTRAVAAVHAGWRGAAGGVLRAAVRELAARDADPATLLAAIGPCICGRCYQVGPEVARRFPESADPDPAAAGKFLLDLGLAVEVSLIAAGLSTRNIERIQACNHCRPERLFSHRGSGGRCGRGIGYICA